MFKSKASLAAAAVMLAILLVSSASAQYIYVANAGEDTVSKIDINAEKEVARYATWFTSGPNHVPHLNNSGDLSGVAPAPSDCCRTPREMCTC